MVRVGRRRLMVQFGRRSVLDGAAAGMSDLVPGCDCPNM